MGNSGNASPTFSILDYGPASDDYSSSFEKDPDEPDSADRSRRLADFEGPPTQPLCRKRKSSLHGGSAVGQGSDSTLDGGPDKPC